MDTGENCVGILTAWLVVVAEAPRFGGARKFVVMKPKSFLFWSMLAFMSTAVIHASGEEIQPYAIPGRYIVVLKQSHRPADVLARHSVKAHHVFSHALNGFAGEIPAGQLKTLSRDPRIESIEPELELF